MSVLLQAGATTPWVGLISSDERSNSSWYQWNEIFRYRRHESGVLWSFSRSMGQSLSANISTNAATTGNWGVSLEVESLGNQGQKKFIGNTLAANGTKLGGCTVRSFRTSDNLFTGVVVSDAGGYYTLFVAYTDAHFIVAYKVGSPDRSGTTVNTLIPI